MQNSNKQRIKERDVDFCSIISLLTMCDKVCRADHVSWNDETPDEEKAYQFHSENSQAASWYNSETDGHPTECHGELQHSPEVKAESIRQKSRAGAFNRLRRRLKSRVEQLPGKRATSSVRAISICSDVEVGGEGTSMVDKKGAPHYQCVPTPPGCIPTEVMMRVDDALYSPTINHPGQGEGATAIEQANRKEQANHDDRRNKNEDVQKNASFSSNVEMCKVDRPTKILINNWIDPE